MLIETKAITQLGLVLGNTWQILAIVVASILILAFFANLWIMWRGPIARWKAFVLLAVSLVAGAAVTTAVSDGWQMPLAKITMPVVLTLPLFFSGLIFSSELARGGELSSILASNLFGAMFGGFLEYNSMYWGYTSLTWLGFAIYSLAYLCAARPLNWPSRWRLIANTGGRIPSASGTPSAA
jgi:hypothetical protein